MQEKKNAEDLYRKVLKNVNPSYKSVVKQIDKGLTTKHLYYNPFELVLPHGRGAGATNAIILSILYGIAKDWELKQDAIAKENGVDLRIKNLPNWHTAKEQDRKIVGHAAIICPEGYSLLETMKQVAWCMNDLGVADSYNDSLPKHSFEHKDSGAKIYIIDANKFANVEGRFKYLFCLAAESLSSYREYLNLMNSAFRFSKPEINTFCFVEYNVPESVVHWTYSNFTSRRNGVCFRKFLGSYLTMPKEWLGDSFFAQANMLKKMDKALYLNEYLGKPIRILERT